MSPFWKRHGARVVIYGLLAIALPVAWYLRGSLRIYYQKGVWRWPPRVSTVLKAHEARVRARYEPILLAAGAAWPPRDLILVALKEERRLEAWDESHDPPVRIGAWQVLAGSPAGHKLKAGDGMVPEGFYRLTTLNPESNYHLSIRVDYPSEEDVAHATAPNLGDDIYVHGKNVSIGCLAMGDAAIEEIFVLAARATSRRIVISPVDFRRGAVAPDPRHDFVRERYQRIAKELDRFRVPITPDEVCSHLDSLRLAKDPTSDPDPTCADRMPTTRQLDGPALWKLRSACILAASSVDDVLTCNQRGHPDWPLPSGRAN